MRALQISAYGNPSEVLRLAEIPETGAPDAGEVLIEIELAPLNKHDLLFMRCYFGGPVAPTVVGNEGYGRVAAVGPNVKTRTGLSSATQSSSRSGNKRLCARASPSMNRLIGSHSKIHDYPELGPTPHREALRTASLVDTA